MFGASIVATIAIAGFLRLGRSGERRRRLLQGFLELAVPLALTSGIFAALQRWVHAAANGVQAVTTIRDVEFAIRFIRGKYIERFVLPAWIQLCIIAFLVLLGILWPNIRAAGVLDGFKHATRWATRAQILATLLASFTFFGAVQATNARGAEVRLADHIREIERRYADAFAAAHESVAVAAAAELLSDPGWAEPLQDLATALEEQRQADQKIATARAMIAAEPHSKDRGFTLAVDDVPRAAAKVRYPERIPVGNGSRRETQSQAEGERLVAEAEQLRREVTTELVHAASDAGREALAQRVVREYFAGSTTEGFSAVLLDASVLYDFRDVVAKAATAMVERVVQRREGMRTAFDHVLPALRTDVAPLAPIAARTATSAYAKQADESRTMLAMAEQIRRDTLDEYRSKANAQAKREYELLRETVTSKLDFELASAATRALRDQVERPGDPAMARIARIRALTSTFGWSFAPVAILAQKEQERGGRTPLNDAIEDRARDLMWNERLTESRSADFMDHQVSMAWEKDRKAFAMTRVMEGATEITAHEWESARRASRTRVVNSPQYRAAKARTTPKRRAGK